MFGSIVADGDGAGVLPDMSIPGMFGSIAADGDGAGVLPDMSIPGISMGIPASEEDVDPAESIMTTTTLATATARTTAEITIRRIPFRLFMCGVIPKVVVPGWSHTEDLRQQVSEFTLGAAPRDSPPQFHEGSVKTAAQKRRDTPNGTTVCVLLLGSSPYGRGSGGFVAAGWAAVWLYKDRTPDTESLPPPRH